MIQENQMYIPQWHHVKSGEVTYTIINAPPTELTLVVASKAILFYSKI